MDKKLLLDLFRIPAPSKHEEFISLYIRRYLKSIGKTFVVDEIGNIYNIAFENKPLVACHMDTVQKAYAVLLTKFIRIVGNKLVGLNIIGGDDKCGIYIVLKLLEEFEINFAFFVGEEIGTIGSGHFVKNNDLSHILYSCVFDRKGNADILCTRNSYGTMEFEDALYKVGEAFGYRPDRGTYSDADELSKKISSCNLSSGYYNAHTEKEYVELLDLENALNFGKAIITNITDKFEAPEKYYAKTTSYYPTVDWRSQWEYKGYGKTKQYEYSKPTTTIKKTGEKLEFEKRKEEHEKYKQEKLKKLETEEKAIEKKKKKKEKKEESTSKTIFDFSKPIKLLKDIEKEWFNEYRENTDMEGVYLSNEEEEYKTNPFNYYELSNEDRKFLGLGENENPTEDQIELLRQIEDLSEMEKYYIGITDDTYLSLDEQEQLLTRLTLDRENIRDEAKEMLGEFYEEYGETPSTSFDEYEAEDEKEVDFIIIKSVVQTSINYDRYYTKEQLYELLIEDYEEIISEVDIINYPSTDLRDSKLQKVTKSYIDTYVTSKAITQSFHSYDKKKYEGIFEEDELYSLLYEFTKEIQEKNNDTNFIIELIDQLIEDNRNMSHKKKYV